MNHIHWEQEWEAQSQDTKPKHYLKRINHLMIFWGLTDDLWTSGIGISAEAHFVF